MQNSPFEIKSRLLRAVDREYNVVDMDTVLEIVTILERTPITKEALETTRLGRDINELRRKTTNESLAKRAKDLVRRWRDLILPQAETAAVVALQLETAAQNGAPPATPPAAVRRQPLTPASSSTSGPGPGPGGGALRSNPISPAVSLPASEKSNVSPALSTSRLDAVPRTHASNKRLRKEDGSSKSKSTSPELPPNKKSRSEQPSPVPEPSVQPAAETRVNGDHYDSVGSDCEIVSVTPAAPPTPSKTKNRKKAPKDRTKKKKGGGDIVKEKIASIARLHKVKTTQELLAGLQSKSGDNCVFPSEDIALNKSEHIVRFLRSQSENDEDTVVDVEGRSDDETGASGVKGPEPPPKVKKEKDKPPAVAGPAEVKPPFQTPEEILARLPPLDVDGINWGDDVDGDVAPAKTVVTDADVDRVLNEHWEGVNGNYEELEPGGERVFREWHEVYTTVSNGAPLHILPYVVID